MQQFKKIDKAQIQGEIDDGKVYPAARLRQLFWVLVRANGFENPRANIPYVAGLIYVDEPAEDQGRRSSNKENTDQRMYGDHRLNSIISGNLGFTFCEAKVFHIIFTRVFGREWGDAVPPEKLITQDINGVIFDGISSGLSWPDSFHASNTLLTFANEHPVGLKLELKAWSEKTGSQIGQGLEKLEAYDPRPILEGGWQYSIEVSGIPNSISNNLFIFEVPDFPMQLDRSNQLYDIFPVCLEQPDSDILSVYDFNKELQEDWPFSILEKHKGGFTYYCLTYPGSWEFEDAFGIPFSLGKWDTKSSRAFLKNLRKRLMSDGHSIQLATYPYRVE